MSREIKFRAWLKETKEMIPVYTINFATQVINAGHPWRFFDEIELMQYTGLKDKNGVEIYEGDILLEKNCNIWEEYTNDDGEKCSKMTGKTEDRLYTVYYNEKTCNFTTNRVWLFTINNYTEVIGNIYHNPELLEVVPW